MLGFQFLESRLETLCFVLLGIGNFANGGELLECPLLLGFSPLLVSLGIR